MIQYIIVLPSVLENFPLELRNSDYSIIHACHEIFNPEENGIIYKVRSNQLIELYSEKYMLICDSAQEAGTLKASRIVSIDKKKWANALDVGEVISGACQFITTNEAKFIKKNNSDNTAALANQFNRKFLNEKSFEEFQKYWENIDATTKFRKEILDQQFSDSIAMFSKLDINTHNEQITLTIKNNNNSNNYRLGMEIFGASQKEWTENYDSKTKNTDHIKKFKFGVVIGPDKAKNLIKINSNPELIADLMNSNFNTKEGVFWVEDIGSRVKLKNEKYALKLLFKEDTANPQLKNFIPDVTNAVSSNLNPLSLEKNFLSKSFNNLNTNQKYAVTGAINSSDLFLIQGPPGTGKTTVISEIVQYLINRGEKILVSAQTHLAVDNVLQRVGDDKNVNAIRIGDKAKFELGNEKYLLENRIMSLQDDILKTITEKENRYTILLNNQLERKLLYKIHDEIDGKIQPVISLLESSNPHRQNYRYLFNQKLALQIDYENSKIRRKHLYEKMSHPKQLKNVFDLVTNSNQSISKWITLFKLAPVFNLSIKNIEDISRFISIMNQMKNNRQSIDKEHKLNMNRDILEVRQKIKDIDKKVEELISKQLETGIYDSEMLYAYSTQREVYHRALQDKLNSSNLELIDNTEQSKGTLVKLELKRLKILIDDFIAQRESEFFVILGHNMKISEFLNFFEDLQTKRESIEQIGEINDSLILELEHYKDFNEENQRFELLQSELGLLNKKLNDGKKIIDYFEEKMQIFKSDETINDYLAYYKMDIQELSSKDLSRVTTNKEQYNKDNNFKKLYEKTQDISQEWKQSLKVYQESFEQMYLDQANLVTATCLGIATLKNNYFKHTDFDYLIIDEAGRASSLELLIPMVRAKHIILVGDHKQISPEIEKQIIEKMEADDTYTMEDVQLLRKSMFGIMYENAQATNKVFLNTQFRMSPAISQVVSDYYYDGEILNGENVLKMSHGLEDKLPSSFYWISTPSGVDKYIESKKGNSYFNQGEIDTTIDLLKHLNDDLTEKKSLGIISPYKAHTEKLQNLIEVELYSKLDIEINTIDAFQGREKQIIIINFVRNNNQRTVGFIKNDSRMNVALSRARELQFVVGNLDFIQQNKNQLKKINLIIRQLQNNHYYLRAERLMKG